MIGLLDIGLRLTIWFLLTADLSPANILIGFLIAFILPRKLTKPRVIRDGFHILWEILIAIPQAYYEAFEMIFRPHQKEAIVQERIKPNRTPGLIFLDIFLITFTPKTIVTKYKKAGWYEVHRVKAGRAK